MKVYAGLAITTPLALPAGASGCGGLGCCGAAFSPSPRFLLSATERALPAAATLPIAAPKPLRRGEEASSVGSPGEGRTALFSAVMSRRPRVWPNLAKQNRRGNAMQGHSTARQSAPSSALGCTHVPQPPKQASFGGLAGRGQAIRARGDAPALADVAGRPRSIGSAIAFHPRAKRR